MFNRTKWILINESTIPNDNNLFDSAIDGTCLDNSKYSPTVNFMEYTYAKLNKILFMNALPIDMKFKIVEAFDEYVGDTIVMRSSIHGSKMLFPTTIVLNNSLTLTIRDWVNVMIHEMIHAYDVEYRSNEYNKADYKEHEGWFMNQVNRINKKYGFEVKANYENDFGVNDDLPKPTTNYLILIDKEDDVPMGIIISEEDKDECLEYIYKEIKKKIVLLLTTSNTLSDSLNKLNPKTGEYTIYSCDDDFTKEFGPFFDAKTISLKKMFMNESTEDDEPEDIKILRQIKGIRNLRKVKDGWEFHIS